MRRALALLVLFALTAIRADAQPSTAVPDQAACVASYEQGQKLRKDAKLTAAHEEFLRCAHAACPDVTKGDCTTWASEVETATPTLVLSVKDPSGQDVIDVAVTLDGAPWLEKLSGQAVPIDPGEHRLRFSLPGQAPIERSLVVREGEKARAIEVSFVPDEPSTGPSPATWVLAGAGGAGFLVFGILGGVGLSEKSDAESSCAPTCTSDVIDSIEAKFIGADVGLAVGAASLAAALVVGLVTGLPSDKAKAAAHVRMSRPGTLLLTW